MSDNRIPHLLETNLFGSNLMEVNESIMQAQAQISKGALLNEAHLKTTTETIKEITPFGIRAEVNLTGEVVGPSYHARSVSTLLGLLKTDGTGDWEGKAYDITKEGDIVIGTSHGTLKMTGPYTNRSEGEIIFMTQSPKLSWLNNKKCRLEGTVDSLAGEVHVKIFAL